MGYMHIENLYKNRSILLFKECYAMEKIHGTSAHVRLHNRTLNMFPGGEKLDKFAALFDPEALRRSLIDKFGDGTVVIFGEAYGGKQQGMSATYGKELKFIVFDVKIGERFVNVPVAAEIAKDCGLEFVPYKRVPNNEVYQLDLLRDEPSEQAFRNGCAGNTDRFGFCPPIREGVVLRPIHECQLNNGARVICKHKRSVFSERATEVPVDEAKLKVLEDAQEVAREWVTATRLEHVLDKLGNPTDMSATGKVIAAMVEDVTREAADEIIDTPDVRRAVGKTAAALFKARVTAIAKEGA